MKKGAQSHEELVVWQLSYQLKLGVYELIKASPIRTDRNLHDQLRNAARAAPRLIAEGFGRYLRSAAPPNEPTARRPRRRANEPPEPPEPDL